MNTLWPKIAGIVVLAVIVIVAITIFTGKEESQQKTVYDQWEEDEKKLTAEPQFKEPPTRQQPAQRKPVKSTEPAATPTFKELTIEEQVEAEQKWQWVLSQRKMARLPGMSYKRMVDTCREIIRRWPESKYAFYAKRTLADIPERYDITDEETNLGNLK